MEKWFSSGHLVLSHLGLAFVLMLRPFFPELVMSTDLRLGVLALHHFHTLNSTILWPTMIPYWLTYILPMTGEVPLLILGLKGQCQTWSLNFASFPHSELHHHVSYSVLHMLPVTGNSIDLWVKIQGQTWTLTLNFASTPHFISILF